jgi:hypothetical protein
MDKAHDIQRIAVQGDRLLLTVDGRSYDIDVAACSRRLARASQTQRENFTVSPSGYGIHWPDIDEDLSIDGLIGITHECPLTEIGTE